MEIRRSSRSSPPPYGAQLPREPRLGQGRALMSRASADRSSRAIDKHPVVERPIYDVTDATPATFAPRPPSRPAAPSPALRAPRPAQVPVVFRDEATSDDATIVLPRKSIGAHVQRPAIAPPSLPDPTPMPEDYDPENTVVDPPSFLTDSSTYDTQKPVDKR